jgi:membrane protein
MKSLARRLLSLAAAGAFAGYLVERARDPRSGAGDARLPEGAHSLVGIGWSGWRRILSRAIVSVNDDRLFSLAAGVSFYAILALAPAMTVFVSMYGLLADPSAVVSQLQPMTAFFPDAARDLVIDQAQRLAGVPGRSLSFGLLAGFAVAAWSANAAIKGMFDALNVIFRQAEKRSFVRFNAVALSVTIGAAAVMVGVILFVAAEPILVGSLAPQSGGLVAILAARLRWPIFLLIAAPSIAVLYRIGPSRTTPPFSPLWPGAFVAAALWEASSEGFAWYVSRMGNYQAVYGSLATVAIFLTWVWLSASAVLIGAILNAEIEREVAPVEPSS